ncbi:MAG: adenylate/guanylate cyclase domain-containing protein, partial [Hyphomicrobiales bacterium]|nr:adenylate/guanylate cyclase domain-containing protein [Hyphomicrobiales bacterium]
EADEELALATLSGHRRIIDEAIIRHRGRIAGTAGDSVLAEFASVIDAVHAAIEIQHSLADANDALPEGQRMRFRIGINVGDVMVKDGDIFGDGVNIAARLETLAEPGGICVSRGVRDHLRKHRIVVFDDLGEQKVKNIAQPIRAFRVRMGEAPSAGDADGDSEAGEEFVEDLGPSLPPSTIEDPEVEIAFWDSIKDSDNVAEFEVYLDRYPDGAFSALAKTRRDALLEEPPVQVAQREGEEAVAVELAFWESARDSGDCAELEAYLERYPSGEFVALARARLERLRSEEKNADRNGSSSAEGPEVELAFWDSIKDSGNPEMFRAYLEKYPNGNFAALARINIDASSQ